MREELRATHDRLVAALLAHVEAAEVGARPDAPDPLPEPTAELAAALRAHAEVLERFTGAIVPWEVVLPPTPQADTPSDQPSPTRHGWVPDDVDWAGDAERWR